MTSEHHERVKAIFLEAVSASPAERNQVIALACQGDRTLAAEVEKLLAHHDDGDETSLSEAIGVSARGSDSAAPAGILQAAAASPVEQSRSVEFNAGTTIADRYRIVSQIGRGGMGVVYRAEDLKLAQQVALKFLSPALSRNPAWVARLREEVRIARSVTHPGVCRVYDIGETGKLHYLTMEYVDGEDLASLLRRAGPLAKERAFQIGRQVCFALHAAHHAGVVHRDLKPGNILIDRSGNARITDFGLAVLRGQGRTDLRGGTPAYMAPEQITGVGVTARADLYALALVLYELLAGQPAISVGSLEELLDPTRRSTPPPLGSLVKDLPPGLEGVIERCLSPEPGDRPESALLVAAEIPGADVLRAALEAGETPTPNLIAVASPRLVPGRWRVLLAGTTFALLALLVLIKSTSKLPWDNMGAQPPAVLRDQGERLLTSLMRHDLPPHRAVGFCDAQQLERAARERLGSTAELRLDSARGPFFWLRTAPAALVPSAYDNVLLRSGSPTLQDPPATAGSASLAYDRDGRLIWYAANPPPDSLSLPETSSAISSELDALLKAAVLSSDAAIPMEASAHVVSFPAQWEDRPVTGLVMISPKQVLAFAVASGTSTSLEENARNSRRRGAWVIIVSILFLGLLGFTAPWAWSSYRSGRADLEGAFRLATTLFAVVVLVKALRLPTGAGLTQGLQYLMVSAFYAAGAGALLAAFYLALDRHARKYWPDKLVTWTRAVHLRWADPAVRNHLLIGVSLGVFWAVLVAAERRLVSSMGWPVGSFLAADRTAERLLGTRSLVAGLLDIMPLAVLYGLLFMLVLVVAQRAVAHRTWAGVLALMVLVIALVPRGAHPYTSWAFYGIGGAAVCLWAMMRFGLLTLVVGLIVAMMLNTTPMTLDPGSWHADAQMIVLGLISIGVLYGALARPAANR